MSQKPRLLVGVTCNQEEFCYPADSPDMERGGWPHRERKLDPNTITVRAGNWGDRWEAVHRNYRHLKFLVVPKHAFQETVFC